jgi:two-component system OmpR family sensor kinase
VTIKTRVTAAMTALLVTANGLLGWVIINAAEKSMLARIDVQLRRAADRPPAPSERVAGTADASYRLVGELVVSPDGATERAVPAGFADHPEPPPRLPRPLPVDGRIRTVPAVDSALEYRILVRPTRQGTSRVVIAPLRDVTATTDQLWRIMVIATAGLLLVGGYLVWWITRQGLRPVNRMIETAAAIAGGDLRRRVDHPTDNTELGRLANVLDDMLSRLESAFTQREAEQQRLRRFVADASHELRTPLSAISGYTELFSSGGTPPGPALERAMTRIKQESTRMSRLVTDLLLLARLDQQRPLASEPVDLTTLVHDAADDLRAMDPHRPVSLHTPKPVTVSGDETRLRQVLANLLHNVHTHTPPHCPTRLRVSATADRASILVADDGPGIQPDHQKRVFDRFHRADPSRSRDTGGTGLGLAIVDAIIRAHGGTVHLHSTPGHGTSITVTLRRTHTPGTTP